MGEVSFVCAPESVTIKDDSVTLRVPKTYIESLYVTSLENLHMWNAIEIGGIKWVIYGFGGEEDADGNLQVVKLVSVKSVTEMAFGNCNNWLESSVRSYLYTNILPKVLGNITDEKDVVPITMSLIALDGTKPTYSGKCEEDIAILSFDEYRNNRLGISTIDEDVLWTLTAWSCHGLEPKMCCIERDRTIDKANVSDSLAVHPIIWLKRNAKIRQPTNYVKVDMSW